VGQSCIYCRIYAFWVDGTLFRDAGSAELRTDGERGEVWRKRKKGFYKLDYSVLLSAYFSDGVGISCGIDWLRRVLLRDARDERSAEVMGFVIDGGE